MPNLINFSLLLSDTPPDLPYYVNRTRYHDFPVVEKKKGDGRQQTIVHYVDKANYMLLVRLI